MAIQKNSLLFGVPIGSIVCRIPERDVFRSMTDGIPDLLSNLEWDAVNVLLTFARIWYTLANKKFASKDKAA